MRALLGRALAIGHRSGFRLIGAIEAATRLHNTAQLLENVRYQRRPPVLGDGARVQPVVRVIRDIMQIDRVAGTEAASHVGPLFAPQLDEKLAAIDAVDTNAFQKEPAHHRAAGAPHVEHPLAAQNEGIRQPSRTAPLPLSTPSHLEPPSLLPALS